MAIKTTTQQLEEVQEAITNTLTAQEMGSGNDKVVRATLKTLYDREDQLLSRLRSESSSGGPAFVTGIMRRD